MADGAVTPIELEKAEGEPRCQRLESDGRDALELIGKHRPDVALLDIAMPGLSGLEVAKRIEQASPKTRTIILSRSPTEGSSFSIEAN